MIQYVRENFPSTNLVSVGFSMGANIVVKYLGESPHRQNYFLCALSVCQGYDCTRWDLISEESNIKKWSLSPQFRESLSPPSHIPHPTLTSSKFMRELIWCIKVRHTFYKYVLVQLYRTILCNKRSAWFVGLHSGVSISVIAVNLWHSCPSLSTMNAMSDVCAK